MRKIRILFTFFRLVLKDTKDIITMSASETVNKLRRNSNKKRVCIKTSSQSFTKIVLTTKQLTSTSMSSTNLRRSAKKTFYIAENKTKSTWKSVL